MSVDVRPLSDHCADLRVMATNSNDDCEAENLEVAKIARIESRPLNLTQFTKRNGRKRRTPQKAMASSEGYQSDSSGTGSPPRLAVDEEESREKHESSILEHYRSFMQRKSNDTNGPLEVALQKASKKQRLSKSMSASVADATGNALINWHSFPSLQQQQNGDMDTSSESSPSFSDVAVNGSGLSGLIPERTMRQNNWAIKVWRDWALTRNRNPETKLERYQEVPVDIRVADIDAMSYWLPKFIKEVRRKDKKPYPADTLMQIASGLQRYLRQVSCRSEVNFFDKYSNTFAEFREALKCRSGELNLENHCNRAGKKVSVENLNDDELWQSGFLNLTTAKGLFHSVFYYNCVEFEVTSMEEHHELKVEQFTFAYDKERKEEYLEFCRGEQRYYNMSTKRVMRIYANHGDAKCLVKLYKTYLDLIPSMGPFYRRPLQTSDHSLPRFSFNPVGINKLRETFKQLFSSDRPASMRKTGKATTIQQMSPQNADIDQSNPIVAQNNNINSHAQSTPTPNVTNASQALYDAITQKLINSGHLKWKSESNAVNLSTKVGEPNSDDSSEQGTNPHHQQPMISASDVMERLRRSWQEARSNEVEEERAGAAEEEKEGESEKAISLQVPQSVNTLFVERGGKKFRFDLN
uniref:Uncharacterized protein LOC100178985 n=1 Tax=Phallusia mammillata TaxID=59560 RepID=A0A6F9DHL9_9ASCI|nr:uncharacterized protein LOC100178985 [Phallusia mammillata]